MVFLEWRNEAFSIGNPRIDYQHRRLINIMNELYDAMSRGAIDNVLGGIIEELEKYTKYHFSTEEEYMKKYNYPDYDFHKREHDYFVDKIKDFKERYKEEDKTLRYEVMNFLRDWIVHHILNVDKRLGNFLKDKA